MKARLRQTTHIHVMYMGRCTNWSSKRETWNLIRCLFAASLCRHASTLALSSRILIFSMTRTFQVHTYLLLRVQLILAHTHEQEHTKMNSCSLKPPSHTRLCPMYIHLHVRACVELNRIDKRLIFLDVIALQPSYMVDLPQILVPNMGRGFMLLKILGH